MLLFIWEGRDGLNGYPDVLAAGLHLAQHIAHSVDAVRVDDVERVDAVPSRLAHAHAFAVLDVGVHEHVNEWQVTQCVQTEHHHAGHPQGDDVASGDEAGTGIKAVQGGGLFGSCPQRCLAGFDLGVIRIGPAERAEWPKRRRKPRVENVRIALQAECDKHVRIPLISQFTAETDFKIEMARFAITGLRLCLRVRPGQSFNEPALLAGRVANPGVDQAGILG